MTLFALQAPGTFPDSQGPEQYFETLKKDQSAGMQLETSRTAVPAPTEETNEAASQAPAVEKKSKPADQDSGA